MQIDPYGSDFLSSWFIDEFISIFVYLIVCKFAKPHH